MTSSTKATIDGIPLSSISQVTWQLTEGVDPYRTTFIVEKGNATTIIDSARDKPEGFPFFELKIQTANENLVFSNLVLVSYAPYSDPRFIELTFADNRIFWSRSHFKGDFNIRTAIGDRIVTRYLDSGSPELEAFGGAIPLSFENTIGYRTFSLYPPIAERFVSEAAEPWTMSKMIERVFLKIDEDMPFLQEFYIEGSVLEDADVDELLQEELQYDGASHSVLHQMMSLIPHIGVYADSDGSAKFYAKHKGAEIGVMNSMDAPHTGSAVPIFVKNDFFIPGKIRVYFESQIELRFNYTERDYVQKVYNKEIELGTFSENTYDTRFLENVIQVPDPEITLTTLNGETFVARSGQYVNFDTYVRALERLGGEEGYLIDKSLIAEYLVNGYVDFNFAGLGTLDVRLAWVARMDAIKTHYRRTFRINKLYRNRMTNIRANLVNIISPTENLTSPSPVYLDYSKRITARGALAIGAANVAPMFVNIPGYAVSLKDAAACPWAYINFTDVQEQSIFHLDFQSDPYGQIETVYPSKITSALEYGPGPTFNLGELGKLNFLDDRLSPDLPTDSNGNIIPAGAYTPDHDMAVIVSATPAASPGVKLFYIDITPGDLPPSNPLYFLLENAKGPTQSTKIDSGQQTARFVWDDSKPEEYDEVFGIQVGENGLVREVEPNYEGLNQINKDICYNLAVAKAIEVWQKFSPRYKGRMQSNLKNIKPNGTINTVSHTVLPPKGHAVTQINVGEEFIGPSFVQLLPSGVRAFVQKFVKKERP